ncbi:MAG: TlyA family RNA methyltransferase [Victivallales bacterium]|nr:TlyA family RNA methyltransferase [Victivallales bacterium]
MKKQKKYRVDTLLLNQGFAENIEEAKKLLLSGRVRIGSDRLLTKTTELLPENTEFNVNIQQRFVSRGAYKILPAVKKHTPKLFNKICIDIGASTGGFTDLMLHLGAERIYAVDSGTGQLHYKLRKHPRVVSMEKTNARYFDSNSIAEKLDIMTMDVSFISVKKIIPSLTGLFNGNAFAYILIKPQFELPSRFVESGGVVSNPENRIKAVDEVSEFVKNNTNWKIEEIIPSELKGPKGNLEYVLCLLING